MQTRGVGYTFLLFLRKNAALKKSGAKIAFIGPKNKRNELFCVVKMSKGSKSACKNDVLGNYSQFAELKQFEKCIFASRFARDTPKSGS